MSTELVVDGDERLVSGPKGRLFLTISAGWGVLSLGQQALPPLLPSIIEDLTITDFQAGLGLSVMWACYAVCQYLGGRIANDLSVKTGLLGGIAVITSGFLLLGVATAYPIFLVATVLIGGGAGLYLIAVRVGIARLFVEHRGQAFGANLAVGMGGNILAAGAATLVVAVAVWRALYFPLVVVLLVVGLLLHAWTPQPYRIARVPLRLRSTLGRVFDSRRMRWLVLVFGLYSFVWQGLIGFLPTYLQSVRLVSTPVANGAFAAVFLIGIVMSPVAGRLSDQYSRPAVGALSLAVTGSGVVVLLSTNGVPGIVATVILVGVGLHGYPPVMQAYLMDRFPDASMGSDFGAFRTVYTGIGSIGPAYVGFVSSVTGFTVAFAGLAAGLGVSLVVLYLAILR